MMQGLREPARARKPHVMRAFDPLPIDAALPDLTAALRARPNAVLVAPPGAGKTTRVPVALLDEPWARGGKLILLEPRRLAARAAADRMAQNVGGEVGGIVGLRMRLGSKIGRATRVEVVTEGVFARLILDDPALTGIAGVLFDEFHERSLDADLGLALALDAQGALREDLRLLVMSATLDGARVAGLLGDAPVIRSEGRAFPVETRYLGRDPDRRIDELVADAVVRALRADPGSLLVFLPGQGEIRRVERLLRERIADPAVDLAPLYGALDRAEQDRAVAPSLPGRRKIVLATSIAETSLTIEGVRVVIDCGLSRVPRYEPDIGLTRLETVRVSRAGADQRRGRAGRTEPGVCYRLWHEAANGALEPYGRPEILSADLSSLLLDCAAWGVTDPAILPFLDAPPRAALSEARALLADLGALDGDGRLTEIGRQLRALPLPPRLAKMVVSGRERRPRGRGRRPRGGARRARPRRRRRRRERTDRALPARPLAPRRRHAPPGARLGGRGHLSPGRRGRAHRRCAGRGERRDISGGGSAATPTRSQRSQRLDLPHPWGGSRALLALAYPDRLAKARGRAGEFLLANGRGAALDAHERLAREPFLAVAEITGGGASSRIVAAAPISLAEIEEAAGARITDAEETTFDRDAGALRARAVRRLGALVLSERPRPIPATDDAARLLARGLAGLGLVCRGRRRWRNGASASCSCAAAKARNGPTCRMPPCSAPLETWLAPHLVGKAGLADLGADDLAAALRTLLPWPLQRRLETEAPTHVEVPTGSRIPVDYGAPDGPVLAVRVQELFGLDAHPSIAGGRVPLILHLLSPAHRPIQITRDLPGFWRGSWAAVKADMRGQYPKHPWPDDPLGAAPTRRAKPRGS